MASDRITRLNAQLQRELGLLCESHIRPAMPGVLITVTGVELASNLRNANVFVSIYGAPGDDRRALEFLKSKRHLLQAGLARQVIMKYTPVLNFKLDGTAARADRVMNILKELDLPDDEPPATPVEDEK
ncbi:MAG: 30S ribosome-binding factor RbfA [Victivallales bacterium]|nr:30S ribosome-binding factor RbfA [Victivallales bacterium]